MPGITLTQERKFAEHMAAPSQLEAAIAWIKNNLDPDDVFDDEKLESWATRRGFKTEFSSGEDQ